MKTRFVIRRMQDKQALFLNGVQYWLVEEKLCRFLFWTYWREKRRIKWSDEEHIIRNWAIRNGYELSN